MQLAASSTQISRPIPVMPESPETPCPSIRPLSLPPRQRVCMVCGAFSTTGHDTRLRRLALEEKFSAMLKCPPPSPPTSNMALFALKHCLATTSWSKGETLLVVVQGGSPGHNPQSASDVLLQCPSPATTHPHGITFAVKSLYTSSSSVYI